ncbi:MAG TPA: bifunctional phosphoribosylaminoimidazolecarboxamide formyltransferase/IMP cyclohydrolase [Acidimicrobiia bacterium]|nr:bifunctional phosphoribosylaminoimidazolecarboxamide formyltransferase/IMP cyclohydrolase [Acidimicrobiia bacterium]
MVVSKVEVRRALVSVSDKEGLVPFAARLVAAGVEIVSSGGTARALADAGLPVTAVEDVTGAPEMLGGRVKTLHPSIHGGILADRGSDEHMADLARHGIAAFQLVVSNLYPFRETVSSPGVSHAEAVEQIDIGGPAMVRAAAKNHAWVGIVTSPDQYDETAAAVESGGLDDALRLRLARQAFFHTASYDAAIVNWLEAGSELPARRVLALERADTLRYGENPHQRGARYREAHVPSWWDSVAQHQGLPLSYLNLFDAAAAWETVHDLARDGATAVVIVKHANPCGASVGSDLAEVYQRAFDCDPRSAFGGIVAFSHPVDAATVSRMEAAAQADVVIAPGYADGVIERLAARRKNTRVLEAPPPDSSEFHLRQISGSWLLQDDYRFVADDWAVVTRRQPTDVELADARFAWRVCGRTSSNAIVLAKDGTAWGIGAGQQNRVESGSIAVSKAAGRAAGGAMASDAFFPFPDGLDAAREAGVSVVVQPGGALRDDEVIARADELELAMLFTGERQFRH